MRHTATPWNFNKRQDGTFTIDNNDSSKEIARGLTKTDAQFIVQCANERKKLERALYLLEAFFRCRVSYNSEYGLRHDLENDEPIDGADMVDCVSLLYKSCKEDGVL